MEACGQLHLLAFLQAEKKPIVIWIGGYVGFRDGLEVFKYVYCENHTKFMYKLCGQNAELLLLKLAIRIENIKL